MVLNFDLSIAVKEYDGKYFITGTSLFKLKQCKDFDNIYNLEINNGDINISIICPICGDNHKYNFSCKKLIHGRVFIGGCEKLGIPILYLGDGEGIRNKILRYNNVNKEIYGFR